MEVEKGISEYGTYIHTNILNKIVKVHRQRIQKLTGMLLSQNINKREL
jgi:hypothetical protein